MSGAFGGAVLVIVAVYCAFVGWSSWRSARRWKAVAERAEKQRNDIERWCDRGPKFTAFGAISYDPHSAMFCEARDAGNPYKPGSAEWWNYIDGETVRITLMGIFRHVERLIPEARARVYHELASLYCDWCGRDLGRCLDDRCEGYKDGAPPAWVFKLARRAKEASIEVAAQAIYDALGHPEHPPTNSEVPTRIPEETRDG